jgi:tripartite-type tricarboxylate transporter receptor subunit TctC
MCDQIPHAMPQVQAGNIKLFAIATPERSPALPHVPTTIEAGLPEFQASGWNAMFAPKGTPPDDRGQAGRCREPGPRRSAHA